jgi:hypothetical protein
LGRMEKYVKNAQVSGRNETLYFGTQSVKEQSGVKCYGVNLDGAKEEKELPRLVQYFVLL